jgi:hypothetical protein
VVLSSRLHRNLAGKHIFHSLRCNWQTADRRTRRNGSRSIEDKVGSLQGDRLRVDRKAIVGGQGLCRSDRRWHSMSGLKIAEEKRAGSVDALREVDCASE